MTYFYDSNIMIKTPRSRIQKSAIMVKDGVKGIVKHVYFTKLKKPMICYVDKKKYLPKFRVGKYLKHVLVGKYLTTHHWIGTT